MSGFFKFVKLPSNVASVVCGLFMPIFVKISQWLQAYSNQNGFLLFAWTIIAFAIPFFLSTFDFKYYKKTYGSGWYFFKPLMSKKDLYQVFIPAWKRVSIWFVSAVISSIILNALWVF